MPKKPKSKAAFSKVSIPPKKIRRAYQATAALEQKLREARNSRESDCLPDFFTRSK